MDFLKNFDWKPMSILKISGVAVVAIIVIAFLFNVVGQSFDALTNRGQTNSQKLAGVMEESLNMVSDKMLNVNRSVNLSARNVAGSAELDASIMPYPEPSTVPGDDAEDYEVTEYQGLIETRDLEGTCDQILSFKDKDYIIFERSNQYEHSCDYRFKVVNDNVGQVIAMIEELGPEYLSKNSYTIKEVVNDYTNEIEVLENKLESIEDTLDKAINAYDEITKLATETKDVETLAKIIDSKIRTIERLTQEKIYINEQLDRYTRSKDNQLDRLDYTYFNLNVNENKYINFDSLKDSWQLAIKGFVHDVNQIVQQLTIGLLAVILLIVQYAIYLLLLVLVIKYGWRIVKRIWKK